MARPRAARSAVQPSGCGARSRRCFETRERRFGLRSALKRTPRPAGSWRPEVRGWALLRLLARRFRRRRLKKLLITLVQRSRPGVKRFGHIGRGASTGGRRPRLCSTGCRGTCGCASGHPGGPADRLLVRRAGRAGAREPAPQAARRQGLQPARRPAVLRRSPEPGGAAGEALARPRAARPTPPRSPRLAKRPTARLARRRRRASPRARARRPAGPPRPAAPPCWSPTTCPAATAAATRRADRARPTAYRAWVRGFARGIGSRRGDRDPRARRDRPGGDRELPVRRVEGRALRAARRRREDVRRAPQRRRLHRRRQPGLRPPGRAPGGAAARRRHRGRRRLRPQREQLLPHRSP